MEIDVTNQDYYIYGCSKAKREETQNRLIKLKFHGIEVVGYGVFGKHDIVSGLYIERVWNYTDAEFNEYLQWMLTVIKEANEQKPL